MEAQDAELNRNLLAHTRQDRRALLLKRAGYVVAILLPILLALWVSLPPTKEKYTLANPVHEVMKSKSKQAKPIQRKGRP